MMSVRSYVSAFCLATVLTTGCRATVLEGDDPSAKKQDTTADGSNDKGNSPSTDTETPSQSDAGTVSTVPASMQPRVNELNSLISTANASISTACGCEPRISGEWGTFEDVNQLFRCHDTIDAIAVSAEAYCSTPEAKKAFCSNVGSYTIRFTTERYDQPKFEGKKVVTYCTDLKYTNADELKQLYETFP